MISLFDTGTVKWIVKFYITSNNIIIKIPPEINSKINMP